MPAPTSEAVHPALEAAVANAEPGTRSEVHSNCCGHHSRKNKRCQTRLSLFSSHHHDSLPPFSTSTTMQSEAIPSSSSTSTSSVMDVKGFLASVRAARKPTNKPPAFIHPPPPHFKPSLPAPEDITSRLSDMGMGFKNARKVSQAYLDRAVQMQFLSQSRLATTHKRITRIARQSFALPNLTAIQAKLRNSQKRLYRRDLDELYTSTIGTVKACCPDLTADSENDDDEDSTSATSKYTKFMSGSPDDSDEENDGVANVDDEQALQNMSARASVLLGQMYDLGFTFPRRHEKIKLAEATGLTYRQIGIWYSNRRERNRPSKRSRTAGAPDEAFATRDSTVDGTPYSDSREQTPCSQAADGGHEDSILVEDGSSGSPSGHADGRQSIEEADELFGGTDVEEEAESNDDGTDDRRIPSLSTSVATLDSFLSTPIPAIGDAQAPLDPLADAWTLVDSNMTPFVELPTTTDTSLDNIFDFDMSAGIPEVPRASVPTSVDFTDLSFLTSNPAPPVPATSSASADFLAGFAAAAAAFSAQGLMPMAPWPMMAPPMQPPPAQQMYPPMPPAPMMPPGMEQIPPALPVIPEEGSSRPVKRVRLHDRAGPSHSSTPRRASVTPRSRTSPSHRPKEQQISAITSGSTSSQSSLPHKVPHMAANLAPVHKSVPPRAAHPSLNVMRPIKALPKLAPRKLAPAAPLPPNTLANSGLALPFSKPTMVQP